MRNYITSLIVFLSIVLFLSSCQKQAALSEAAAAKLMIEEKSWSLDYTQIVTAGVTSTKTYIGQPTYMISFYSNGTTNDSDGIIGTYTVEKGTTNLELHVTAKTAGGKDFSYVYTIQSVSDKSLVMIKTVNGQEYKNFFSAN
jgi:hypothetical protein